MARSKEKAIGDRVDLSHLAIPPSKGSAATPDLQAELEVKDVTDNQVESYDIDKIKKKIIVLFLERLYLFMISPHISLERKVEKGMTAMAQWEGTRKIIEWDKRVVDDKDLLEKADKLTAQIQKYQKVLPPKEMAKLELQAADILMRASEQDKNVS